MSWACLGSLQICLRTFHTNVKYASEKAVSSYVMTYFPECVENFFLGAGGSCELCPQNSRSSGGSASMCNCIENHTTMDGSPTTTGENCVCRENYHMDSSNQCVQCPSNSLRTITSAPSVCMCESNRATADGNITTSGSVPCDGE